MPISKPLRCFPLFLLALSCGASRIPAQGSGCGGSSTLPFVPMALPIPHVAWVDPVNGDDGTAAVDSFRAFKTIGAAMAAMQPLVQGPQSLGTVRLLPGRYGSAAADPACNGDVWPVALLPRVSLVGTTALGVFLDGSAWEPNRPGVLVRDPATGVIAEARPVFVAAASSTVDYSFASVSRVTIARADVGLLVTGSGSVDPTIAHVAFAFCRVGVQVHSDGGTNEGAHRPRVVWCTFGGGTTGVAATGGGASFASRARPAIVNSLFKTAHDLEGVDCGSVAASAFDASNSNGGAGIVPPAQSPTPLFDTGAWLRRDLFVGARTLPNGLGSETSFFTDWRLTFTVGGSGLPNPALGGSLTGFPISVPNGTPVGAIFPGELLGALGGAEGPGTEGPPPSTGIPGGTALGYDPAGTFVIGGTMPLTDGFGVTAGGTFFTTMHLFVRPSSGPTSPFRQLFGVDVSGLPVHLPGRLVPTGLADLPYTVPPSLGTWWLDTGNFPLAILSALLGSGPPGVTAGQVDHWIIPVTNGLNVRRDFAFQMLSQAPSGALVISDVQRVFATVP